MKLACLTRTAPDHFEGQFTTLTLNVRVVVEAVVDARKEPPVFRVLVHGSEIGLLRPRVSSAGPAYWEGTIDDPSFPQPLAVVMFVSADGRATLAWDRPRAKRFAVVGG